jgi:hypothetical protein
MVHLYDLDRSTARPSLDLGSIDITENDDIRSPRTPIYQPISPLSPFDPAKLFFNLSAPLKPEAVAPTKNNVLPPPPSDPLAWVWRCHLCRSRWPLGVTRRCLVDGHFYCSGEALQPNPKKKKKLQSCSSEFDYVCWKEWVEWKRNALKTMTNPRIPKGCERCEYPSQCRYGPAVRELVDDQPSSAPMTGVEYTSDAAEEDVARYYSNENVSFESILAKVETTGKSVQSKMTDFYKPDLKRSKSTGEERKTRGGNIAKSAERRPSMKRTLSPIEEEALRSEVGTSLADLMMPLVDLWGYSREKRKSFP